MQIDPVDRLEWIAQTKFWLPTPALDIQERTELGRVLQEAIVKHRVTLISAQAGSGKTTLLAGLPTKLADFQMAWVALDEQDDELIQFSLALVGALRQIVPQFGQACLKFLSNAEQLAEQLRGFAGLLINEINQHFSSQFVLVLDDLHWLNDRPIFQLLEYLIERQPPQMRLVLASRHDPPLPLARLRARGQLAEMRLEQLRFSEEEASNFFNQQLNLDLKPQEIANLLTQTGGWIAALRLMANAWVAAGKTPSPNLGQSVPSERYIFDYLAEEVLNRLPETERAFLLQSSILTELTPALCQAVTGQPNAVEMLDNLYRRNLFLTLVDSKSPTYRYHDLFREFLRHKLQQERPGELAELHKRAAQTQTLPTAAIRHWLAGHWWEEAARLLEQMGNVLVAQGRLNTLHSWLENVPPEIIQEHPALANYKGRYALAQGRWIEARQWLETSLNAFAEAKNEVAQADCLVDLVFCAFNQTDFAQTDNYLKRALALPLSNKNRFKLLAGQAFQSAYQKRWAEYAEIRKESLRLALELDEPEIYAEVLLQTHLPDVHLPGILPMLKDFCHQVLAKSGTPFIQCGLLTLLSYINLLQGNLGESIQTLEHALLFGDTAQIGGLLKLDMIAVDGLQRKWQGTAQQIQAPLPALVLNLKEQEAAKPWLTSFLSSPILDLIFLNNREKAVSLFGQLLELKYPQERPESEIVRLCLQGLLSSDFSEGETLLLRAKSLQQELFFSIVWGDVRLLLAYFYYKWQKIQKAVSVFGELLQECREKGLPGLILKSGVPVAEPLLRFMIEQKSQADYARRLLQLAGPFSAQADSNQTLKLPNSPESLSPRELEVLRLLAIRATNREIAEQLIISETTVKSHVQHILQKLGLESRQQVATYLKESGYLELDKSS